MILWKPSNHQVTPNSLTLYNGLRKGKCFYKLLLLSKLKGQCQKTLALDFQWGVADTSSLGFPSRLSLVGTSLTFSCLKVRSFTYKMLTKDCQQHGADSARRDWGAEQRGVLYWKKTDQGFSSGFFFSNLVCLLSSVWALISYFVKSGG